MDTKTPQLLAGGESPASPCSAKLVAVTEARRALSGLLVEQTMGLRDDINEQAEKLLLALYEAGAARVAALLEKYAPRHHGLSHQRKCPACGGWWPRHAGNCEIAEVISPNKKLCNDDEQPAPPKQTEKL